MTTVFVGGSRRLVRLDQRIRERASRLIEEGFVVLVGDANGADKAIQKFFAERAYPNVVVYHAGSSCRNNIGNWTTHPVEVQRTQRDFNYYAAKDLAMSEAADYGLMIWDGESPGTVNNVLNLLEGGKKVVVYVSPRKEFLTFRTLNDATELLQNMNPVAVAHLDRKIAFRRRLGVAKGTLSPA